MRKRRLIACVVAVLAGPSAVAHGQEMPEFTHHVDQFPPEVWPIVVADSTTALETPDHQRIGQPQTATTIDVLFLYSRNNGGATRTLAERHIRGANDIFVGRRPSDGFSSRGTPPTAANTGITLRLVGYQQAPSRLDAYIREVEGLPDGGTRDSRMNSLLARLRDDSTVDSERRRRSADLVVLWIDAGQSRFANGIAFQASTGFSRQQGFIVMAGATGSTSWWDGPTLLAHEVGHTLGLAHHASERDRRAPYLPHGQGYFVSSSSGTIMTVSRRRLAVFSFDGQYLDEGTSPKRHVRVGDRSHRSVEAASFGAQFVADYEQSRTPTPEPDPEPPPPTGDDPHTANLDGGYQITVDFWYAQDGVLISKQARLVPVNLPGSESVLFYFFEAANAEMLVKVLNACAVNGYRWVFIAAATDLGYRVKVQSRTGRTRYYDNPSGNRPVAVADTQAFSCR